MVERHGVLLAELMGEQRGLADLRKHMAWYLKGFVVGADVRASLGQVSTLRELEALLGRIDIEQDFPESERGVPRGRQGSPRTVALPEGWLSDREYAALGVAAESDIGGG